MSKENKKAITKLYYEDGYTLGRDKLFNILHKKMKGTGPIQVQINYWLKNQKIEQLFRGTRKAGDMDAFRPIKPLSSLSADLIDFTNKALRQYRYILVVIDNFSRYMWTRATTGKTADKIGVAMASIIESIIKEFDTKPSYILSDDGPEFKKGNISRF